MSKKTRQIMLGGKPPRLSDIARAISSTDEVAAIERAAFDRQMEAARQMMARHGGVFSALAKGDSLLPIIPERQSEIDAAHARLARYTVKERKRP